MVLRLGLIAWLAALIFPSSAIDPITTLECHRRQYSYKVQQADSEGRICWDHINVMSCWGRCDSNEIADWKFPYKKSHHPVCLHAATQENKVTLRNCDPGIAPETRMYTFQEAASCACSFCRSSEASCEGLRYRGARRATRQTKRIRQSKRGKVYPREDSWEDLRLSDTDFMQKMSLLETLKTSKDLQEMIENNLEKISGRNFQDMTEKRGGQSISTGQIPFLDTSFLDNDFMSIVSSPSFRKEDEPMSPEERSPSLRLPEDENEKLEMIWQNDDDNTF